MPIINDYHQVCDIYAEARQRGVSLPCFCAEDMETVEALLMAVKKFGEKIDIPDLPVIISWTSRYPGRGQMEQMTVSADVRLGTRMMFAILREFTASGSPYAALKVLPHLDHAFPWLDADMLSDYVDDFASVMFDASEKPLDENITLTAGYVKKVKGRVMVEGAVDEIFESGSTKIKNSLTSVEQAERFLRETGVDLIVPNLGTEHRATQEKVKYASSQAKKIRDAAGKIMVLHGTSSLQEDDLKRLSEDGIIKVNIFTILARAGGQAVANTVLQNLGNVFDAHTLETLHKSGTIGDYYIKKEYRSKICHGDISPKLNELCNPPRRNAWAAAVKREAARFLTAFNYYKFKD